jgi:hypothetical protein
MLHHAVRAAVPKILPDVVYLVTTSGTGSYTTPAGYSKVTVEAIGGGGKGYGNSIASRRAGGGGGGYAKTENLAVTGGSTVVYYQVGTAATDDVGTTANDSWVRVGSNAAPTSTTQGCLGYRGTAGIYLIVAFAGVGGSTVNSIGTTEYAGANGTTGSSAAGGGAGGDGGAGSGTTGGGSGDMKGGNGGAYASGGNAGTAPGGGGSGASSGTPAGAIGRVRITFKP